jgi:hypothetical protein
MNGHNEPFYLWLGKKKLDVSNVSQGRIDIASEIYDDAINEDVPLTDKENKKVRLIKDDYERATAAIYIKTKNKNKQIKAMIEKVGLYLMRQDFIVLNRRYPFVKSCIEYIKRYLLSVRLFKTLTTDQYKEFEDWISIILTGKKKEDHERRKGILDLLEEMVKSLERKTRLNHEKCLELLQTSVEAIAEELTTSTQDHQA